MVRPTRAAASAPHLYCPVTAYYCSTRYLVLAHQSVPPAVVLSDVGIVYASPLSPKKGFKRPEGAERYGDVAARRQRGERHTEAERLGYEGLGAWKGERGFPLEFGLEIEIWSPCFISEVALGLCTLLN